MKHIITEKKQLRKESNHIATGLIIYSLISFMTIMIDMIRILFPVFMNESEAVANSLVESILDNYMKYATSTIAGIALGILFLCIFFRKTVPLSTIFSSDNKMTPKVFFQLLCVFMGTQFLFSIGNELLERGLNLIGYSAMDSINTATETSTTISMFLYAGLIGPIAEELIYRGFVLRSLQKNGKMMSIVISAILFGIMHANLPQSIFAFFVGLLLAYIAHEYSIIWTILLHIINNCLFGDLFSKSISGLGEHTQEIILWVTMTVFFIAALIILWRNRRFIKEYIHLNKVEGKKYIYILTSVAMIIFIIGNLFMALSDLKAI